MRRHGLTAEEGTRTGDGWVMRSNCYCDLLVIGAGRTVRKARRKLQRKMRAHAGAEAAAGMGGPG